MAISIEFIKLKVVMIDNAHTCQAALVLMIMSNAM